MIINLIFCSYWNFTQWLQNHLLICPFKKLTGFDCPGCGFQRSVVALIQGNITQSFNYYPATIPLLITAVYSIGYKHFPFTKKEHIKNSLIIFTGLVITCSYIFKLSGNLPVTHRHGL